MIVRVLSAGSSFKGLNAYLTHDPDAETKERVGWTHTHNLANDHIPAAVNEMLWTARDAELLKQEAGIRAGGRATEKAAKHISLNWSPEERPSKEHMIETAEGFLKHMKWQENQAIFVAHTDKSYSHVHVMLNVVHPETGLRLDDNFERRRAQQWALNYEREQGRIYCEQRLLDPAQRDDALTRPAWEAFREQQKQFERDEAMRGQIDADQIAFAAPATPYEAEWKTLKEFQQRQRQDFFAEGKAAFSEVRRAVYGEVRDEYRQAWGDYFSAREGGADADHLTEMKAALVAEQKAALEARRDAACAELRSTRDDIYQQLLGGQRETRGELRQRQEAGLDNGSFLQSLQDAYDGRVTVEFRETSAEIAQPAHDREAGADHDQSTAPSPAAEGGVHAGAGLLGFAANWFEGLFAPKPSVPAHTGPSLDELIDLANEKARQASEQRLRDQDDERERAYGE